MLQPIRYMGQEMKGKLVDLELHMHLETDKAILVSENGDADKAIWLPKSQIEYEDGATPSGYCEVTLPQWLAEKHGLI